jgi:predicted anti-sigma-YlaC factor YlaD
MSKSLTCRRVREWLQERQDREGSSPKEFRLARAVEAHLEGCGNCRRFRDFLSGFGRELADSLDALSGPPAQRDPDAHLADLAAARPSSRARRSPARWAVPAAAAALLAIAAGTQAPRLAARARVQRSIRAETSALVEELFSRPLAQGVEVGLAGESLLEALSDGDGLQGLGEGEGQAFEEAFSP